jgi:hypothetical protein
MSLTVPELKERIQVRKIHIPPGTTKKDQFVAILVEPDRRLQLQQQQPHGNDLQVNANSTGTTTSSTHNNRPLLTAFNPSYNCNKYYNTIELFEEKSSRSKKRQ